MTKKQKRKKPPKTSTPKNPRTIFEFHDGANGGFQFWLAGKKPANRVADPLEVIRRLKQARLNDQGLPLPNADECFAEIQMGIKLKDAELSAALRAESDSSLLRALNDFADCICRAFDVKRITMENGKVVGMTHEELIVLYTKFNKFMYDLGEQARPLLKSPPSTGSAASRIAESNSAMPCSSDSTNAATTFSTDEPPPSPPASEPSSEAKV